MNIRVLFFAQLRDLCSADEVEIALPEAARIGEVTVAVLLEALYERYHGLRDWDGRILVAADFEYVDRQALLRDGQEIAIMPPVQGG